MALEMRESCERCGARLAADADARICSFECTFCPACTEAMSAVCPNCGGELVPAPAAPASCPVGVRRRACGGGG